MRVLILGGGGFIGQEIAKRHLAGGDHVFIYDSRENKYNDYKNLAGEDITFDNKNRKLPISEILDKYEAFDIVSNQAALVGVGRSQYDIAKFVENNVGFTGEFLQAIYTSGKFPKRLLHAGSMGPYGDYPENLEANEDDYLIPRSIYGVTKLAQEELMRVFSDTYKIPLISLRYFSVYGTKQSPLNPYTGVLSIIANMLLNSDKVVLYDDGTQTRDLINVEDVADAHFIASRREMFSRFYAINIGTGTSVSLEFIAEQLRDIIAPEKEISFTNTHRSGDIMHMRASVSKAKMLLGWEAKRDIFEDMTTYGKFILENKDKYLGLNTVGEEQHNIVNKGLINSGS